MYSLGLKDIWALCVYAMGFSMAWKVSWVVGRIYICFKRCKEEFPALIFNLPIKTYLDKQTWRRQHWCSRSLSLLVLKNITSNQSLSEFWCFSFVNVNFSEAQHGRMTLPFPMKENWFTDKNMALNKYLHLIKSGDKFRE